MPTTRNRGNANEDKYFALVRAFPLRPLRSEKELDQAIQMIDSLLDRDDLSLEEQDDLDVLGDLTRRYELQEHPMGPVPDADVLRHLLESREVTQAEVAQETGIAESTISEVLSGKRQLNRTHIGKLAHYFAVAPSVFSF